MAEEDPPKKTPPTKQLKMAVMRERSTIHLVSAIGMLVIMLSVFVMGFVSLYVIHNKSTRLIVENPKTIEEIYLEKITVAKTEATEQFQGYFSSMEDSTVVSGNAQFRSLYVVSQQGENDYVSFLNWYKQLTYAVASRVNGSGEWHYYFDKDIDGKIKAAKKRQKISPEA